MDLDELRQKIDAIDEQIIELLGQRLKVVDQVGQFKQKHGLAARDNGRFQSLLSKLRTKSKSLDVPVELVEKIYHQIHEVTVARQQDRTVK